jgi:hypothetical protein
MLAFDTFLDIVIQMTDLVSLLFDFVSLVAGQSPGLIFLIFTALFDPTNNLIIRIILSSDWSTDCPIIRVSGLASNRLTLSLLVLDGQIF